MIISNPSENDKQIPNPKFKSSKPVKKGKYDI
jgi:hypothetical protein